MPLAARNAAGEFVDVGKVDRDLGRVTEATIGHTGGDDQRGGQFVVHVLGVVDQKLVALDAEGDSSVVVGIDIGTDAVGESVAVLIGCHEGADEGAVGAVFDDAKRLICHDRRIVGSIAEIDVHFILAVGNIDHVWLRKSDRGRNFNGHSAQRVTVVVRDLDALAAVGVFDADRHTRGGSEGMVVVDHAAIGPQDRFERVNASVVVMGYRLILDDELILGRIVVVIDAATGAGIEVIPQRGDQVIRVGRRRDRVIAVIGSVRRERQIAVGRYCNRRLLLSIQRECKRKRNIGRVVVGKSECRSDTADLDPVVGGLGPGVFARCCRVGLKPASLLHLGNGVGARIEAG